MVCAFACRYNVGTVYCTRVGVIDNQMKLPIPKNHLGLNWITISRVILRAGFHVHEVGP